MKNFITAERGDKRTWAVVLAGGDGARLQRLTRMIEGAPTPNQFSRVYGDRSLLAHTRARLRPVFREGRTLFVVTKKHESFYRGELADVDSSLVVEQPLNRGTGAAVIAALFQVLQHGADAVVAFFPSDHYFADEAAFAATIRSAVDAARRHDESLILIGSKPRWPEGDYGWIEPGAPVREGRQTPLLKVRQFWEKPPFERAHELMRAGGLWNTFVIVGHAVAFLKSLSARVRPALNGIMNAAARGDLDSAYREMDSMDFSKDVLSREPQRLLVMPDGDSGWADLGAPDRVIGTLIRNRIEPEWLRGMREFHVPAQATSVQTQLRQ